MTSTQVSLSIPDKALKERVSKKLKERGATMKFLLISAMEAFDRGEYDFKLTAKNNTTLDDTVMTPENWQHYLEAKKDLDNGVNIVSWEELKNKHGISDV